MKCNHAKSMISAGLDGDLTGQEMRNLEKHMNGCESCRIESRGLSQTRQLLSQVARRKAPEDLALKLRLAISRESARRQTSLLESAWNRIEDAARGFAVPATAGLLTAVLIFGIFLGFSALPLQAGNPDVPLVFTTAPELEQSVFGTAMSSISDDSLVIEAYVDASGRVDDFRILSDSGGPKDLTPQMKNMLIDFMTFTTFRPATSMGRPIPGKAILSFSKISVKG